MTPTFGQLGSGSGLRDAWDATPPRGRSHTDSLDGLWSQNGAGLLFVRGAVHALHAIRAIAPALVLQVRPEQSLIAHDAACSLLYVRHAVGATPGFGLPPAAQQAAPA